MRMRGTTERRRKRPVLGTGAEPVVSDHEGTVGYGDMQGYTIHRYISRVRYCYIKHKREIVMFVISFMFGMRR